MQFRRQPAPVPIQAKALGLIGGTQLVGSASMLKPGMARACVNYEANFNGGFSRVGGIERFSGKPRPSDALYQTLVPATTFTGVVVGNTINGATSGATALVIAVESGYLVVTKVTGAFGVSEVIRVGSTPIGTNTATTPPITSSQDNHFYALAAAAYRVDIAAVPGSGPIRGIATLGSRVFAWRDNVGATAMAIWKDSAAGWVEVPRYYEIQFNAGTSIYVDGGTLTQGSVTATIKRVVLESGSWGSSATGRFIVTQPTGGSGNFANGAAAGSGACTLHTVPATSALAQITYLPGGRVETDTWNFSGSQDTRRLYGCDGINREFEFDGDVWVPLKTGMTVRAKFVCAHKNYLFFAFKGSLQHSVVGSPYQWSAVFGAGELGMGDEITGMCSIGGSEDAAAMVTTCRDSLGVLYGTGPSMWNLVTLSREAGANAYTLQDAGIPIGQDPQGFRFFRPAQSFGNFLWDLLSREIDPIARERTPTASTFSPKLSRYRCFFDDGAAISGTPVNGNRAVLWTELQYGKDIRIAYAGEVDGVTRVFYGDADGFVYEADVGRSFDGDPIQAIVKMVSLHNGSPMQFKQFRAADVEITSESGFTLYTSAEFDDGDPNVETSHVQSFELIGQGGQWDITGYDQSRWDAAAETRQRIEMVGRGYAVAPIFYSNSDEEMPHTIKALALIFSDRNLKRG